MLLLFALAPSVVLKCCSGPEQKQAVMSYVFDKLCSGIVYSSVDHGFDANESTYIDMFETKVMY